jgi:hypothetical protein
VTASVRGRVGDELNVSVEGIVAIVAVVVSIASVWFAFGQARSAKQSATSAQEQAAAARDAVAAAREQVAAAHRQNELQEQMWRDQAQPYVVADVRPDPGQGHLLQVVLENRGSTIARNVQVTFDPPLQKRLGPDQGYFSALDGGVSYLPPGRVMIWHLGFSPDYFKDGQQEPDREVTVLCDGPMGPVEPLRYMLSFEAFRGQSAAASGTLARIEGAIKELTKTFKAQGR